MGPSGGRRGTLTVLSIMLLLLLCSCGTPAIINHIKLVQTAGYDLKGKEIQVSALVGNFKEKENTKVELMKSTSDNSYDMIPLLNAETNEPIQYGQLRMMLFGNDYAKNGIGSVLNMLARDVTISTRLKLGVSETTALELLDASRESQEPLFLMRMLEQNAQFANLPKQNLHTTLYDYFSDTSDLFLPVFKLDADKQIKIDGIALFRGDRSISKISNEQALWLKLLLENAKNGFFVMPVPESDTRMDRVAMIRFASSKVTMSASSLKAPLSLKVKVSGQIIVKNAPADLKLTAPREVADMERQLEAYVTSKLERFIQFCCSKNVDPAGIGDFFRSRDRTFNRNDFYAAYPSLRADVEVDLKIVQCGRQD